MCGITNTVSMNTFLCSAESGLYDQTPSSKHLKVRVNPTNNDLVTKGPGVSYDILSLPQDSPAHAPGNLYADNESAHPAPAPIHPGAVPEVV